MPCFIAFKLFFAFHFRIARKARYNRVCTDAQFNALSINRRPLLVMLTDVMCNEYRVEK